MTITNGSRAVVINTYRGGGYWADLYVNCGPDTLGDITGIRATFRTLAGAERWAARQLQRGGLTGPKNEED